MLIDTHCHIHESSYPLDTGEVLSRAAAANVSKLICVGTDLMSSREAVAFAADRDGVFASIGVHPHEAKAAGSREFITDSLGQLLGEKHSNIVAVGEIGLDYFYTHSPRAVQTQVLEAQIQLALDHKLPIIFHVRDAFGDFWPIFDNFQGIRGELHSFTDSQANLEQGFSRGLYVGVNGISTFTKDAAQQAMYVSIPLGRMLLETDAPFLTPAPLRGRVNEPAFVRNVAEYHATVRGLTLDQIATATTANAHALFAV